MPPTPPRSLSMQIVWPFLIFVVTGCVALTLWMRQLAQRESRAVFTALANTHAALIRSRPSLASEQTVRSLGQVLNMDAFLARDPNPFLTGGPELTPAPSAALQPFRGPLHALAGGHPPVRLGKEFEAVSSQVSPGLRLVIVRRAESLPALGRGRETASVLALFCLASAWLAWAISRSVRPVAAATPPAPPTRRDTSS